MLTIIYKCVKFWLHLPSSNHPDALKATEMKCSELLRLLKKAGWVVVREGKGSHKILAHPDKPNTIITFPDHGSDEMSKGLAEKFKKQARLK